ncbi:unnamed protein product, partial [Mesorhabditis belari]|uniref:C-type lectin domain-containing protein n=1 Tax=Mesorhabditis belari TaxID=2138241 RepID=A0AAF3FSK7_9BILA
MLHIVFVCLFVLAQAGCPDGSVDNGNGGCLRGAKTATPFIYAESGCSLAGGHLSSITSAFVNEVIRSYVAGISGQSFLIGLQRNWNGWAWSDGSSAQYLNFDSGEPGNDSCVLMSALSGKWRTTACHTTNPFVCTLSTIQMAPSRPSCPSEWTYYASTKSCYFKGKMKSWLDAESDCVSRGGHLASIHTKDEADFVTGMAQIDASCQLCSQLKQRYRMWIGGQTINGNWAWTDGTPYDYSPYGLPADRDYFMMVNTDSDCREDPSSAYVHWKGIRKISRQHEPIIEVVEALSNGGQHEGKNAMKEMSAERKLTMGSPGEANGEKLGVEMKEMKEKEKGGPQKPSPFSALLGRVRPSPPSLLTTTSTSDSSTLSPSSFSSFNSATPRMRARPPVHPNATTTTISNDGLGNNNENTVALQQKITELEVQVEAQNGELLVLRASMADVLRRLAKLEGDGVSESQTSTHRRSPHRTVHQSPSRSSISSASTTTTTNPMTQSLYVPAGVDENHTFRPISTLVNVSMGRSPRGSPIRKWMSSYDMKDAQNNQTQPSSTFSPLSRKQSANSINKTASTQSLVSANLGIPNASTVGRGVSTRSPSYNSLASSRLLRNTVPKEPTFTPSTHILHVMVNGRTVAVPVPEEVTEWNLHQEQPPPPGLSPRIDWVYGLSIKETGDCVHQLLTAEIVYPVGTLAVLYNREDHCQRHYTQHTSEIRSIAMHPNRRIVASGQTSRHTLGRSNGRTRSPVSPPHDSEVALCTGETQAHVRLWDSVSLTTLHVIGTFDHWFERSISSLAFSQADGGALLACVDEGYQHMLTVWDWNQKKKVAEAKSASDSTTGLHFHSHQRNSIIQYGKGHFSFWTLDIRKQTLDKISATFEGRDRPKAVLSICFPDESTVVVGDSNGSISQWNVKSGKMMRIQQGIHPGGVLVLAMISAEQFVSGGVQKMLYPFDTTDFVRSGVPIVLPENCINLRSLSVCRDGSMLISIGDNKIFHGDQQNGFQLVVEGDDEEISSINVNPHTPRLLCTSRSGLAKVWDTEERRLIWSKYFEDGITGSSYSHCGAYIALGTESGRVLVVDGNSKSLLFDSKYSTQPIVTVRFSPTSNILAVSTKEPSVLLLRSSSSKTYSNHARIATLPSPVNCIDFSEDGQMLRFTTTIGHLLFFSLQGDSVTTADARQIRWSSGNCVASFEASIGASSTGNVTAGCLGGNEKNPLVVLGRQDGTVRLYSSPVKSCEAGFHELRAGAAPITQVSSKNDSLFTTAQNGVSVLQWKC